MATSESRAKIITALLLPLAIIFLALFQPAQALADTTISDESESVHSFQKDYFMGIFHKSISNGNSLFDDIYEGVSETSDDDTGTLTRKEINFEIAKGTSTTYSLYDRFGGFISYPLYLGEEIVTTSAADKIYDSVAIQGDELNISFKTIRELLGRGATTYTDKFYSGRPTLKTESTDPRVNLYNGGSNASNTTATGFSNYNLAIAEMIVSVTAFFTSDDFANFLCTTIKALLDSNVYENLTKLLKGLIIVFGFFLILFITKSIFSVIKGGSVKQNLVNVLGSILTVILLYAVAAQPAAIMGVTEKVLTFADDLVAMAFNDEDNEIIHSDINDHVIEATLWYTAIYEPWCEAVFGDKYENLYTQYAEVDSSNKMAQGEKSSTATGDIYVSTGSGEIRNWAALAYSCQSVYHLDALGKTKVTTDDEIENWPKADMTSNKSIYNDDFRWIDALLNVGNTQSGVNKQTEGYVDYNEYEFNGLRKSFESLWYALLLAPILYFGIRKTGSLLASLGNVFSFMYRSCASIVVPDNTQLQLPQNIKAMVTPIINYFWFVIMILISTTLYTNLVSLGLLAQILYLAITVYLGLNMMPANIKNEGKKLQSVARDTMYSAKNAWNARQETIEEMDSFRKRQAEREHAKYQALEMQQAQEGDTEEADIPFKEKDAHTKTRKSKSGYIWADQYLDTEVLSKTKVFNGKNDFDNCTHEYEDLQNDIRSAIKVSDVSKILSTWRSSSKHKSWDYKILGIERAMDVEPRSDFSRPNEYYNASVARKYGNRKRAERKVGSSAESSTKIMDDYKKQLLENERIAAQQAKANSGEEYDKILTKLNKKSAAATKKELLENSKKAAWDSAEIFLANATGNNRLNTVVSLRTKAKIIGLVIAAYVVLGLIAAIVGF